MLTLEAIYRQSPVLVQNFMATGYGLKERILRYGGNHQSFLRQFDEAQWWSREELQDLQNRQLKQLVAFCYERVPFYRDLFKSLKLRPEDIQSTADLAQLPILEKETVREYPDRFRPLKLEENVSVQTTGGTTGKPLRYYVTDRAMQFNCAMYEGRFRNWAGVRFGERMASINGRTIVPVATDRPPFWRHNLAFNQLYLSPSHLSETYLPSYVQRLESFKPKVIVGYVSTVHVIAKHILAHKQTGIVAPKAVLVSSETLFEWMRRDIESAFGCKVFNGYSLGELVAFISECEQGSLHISPEYGVVETAKAGSNYELICTGLFNYAMPLLRYRTGDVVELKSDQNCPCGRNLPVIGSIVGRVDDRVVNPEGMIVGPAALSLAFQRVRNLKEAQIHQSSPAKIRVHLSVTNAFSSGDQEFVINELRKRLGNTIGIEIIRVNEIPRTPAGKQRLIVSTMKPKPADTIDRARPRVATANG